MEVGILNKPIQHISVVICCFAIIGMIAFSINTILNMPHVNWDINGNCIEVISPDPSHSCQNLPRKYTSTG